MRGFYAIPVIYGALPAANQIDGLKDVTFTAVGYGLQKSSMLLSNNAATGATCFGDSGGPNFLGSSSVIAGVTSYGINGERAGTRRACSDWIVRTCSTSINPILNPAP